LVIVYTLGVSQAQECFPGQITLAITEVSMYTTRLLLPFQQGVDRVVIEQAVRLAKGCNATLVPLSILVVKSKLKSPRLDFIQQSKDFLEATKHLAEVWDVPFEAVEVVTHDAGQAISTIAVELQCEGIVVFLGHNGDVLLSADTIQYLIEAASYKLYVMHISSSAGTSVLRTLREAAFRVFIRKPASD
jgi:hypothetical protein